jgi:hypothetical protein
VWKTKNPIWYSAIGIPKKSPLKPFLSRLIDEMKERGQINQLIKLYEYAPSHCGPGGNQPTELSFEKSILLFLILVSGMFLGMYQSGQFLCSFYDIHVNNSQLMIKFKYNPRTSEGVATCHSSTGQISKLSGKGSVYL